MQAFLIELIDEVGDLARIANVIAGKQINITGFSGASRGAGGTAVVTVADNDVTELEQTLQGIPVGYREYELVEITFEDHVGALAAKADLLANAGVSIEAAIPTCTNANDIVINFAVSDPDAARQALQ
jgi:hypothetical protein